jgi:hypothetical protein
MTDGRAAETERWLAAYFTEVVHIYRCTTCGSFVSAADRILHARFHGKRAPLRLQR